MQKHLERSTQRLRRELLALGSLVEESLYLAVRAVQERDPKLADKVREADEEINNREVELEEECLKVLALNQPAGTNLRLIVAAMKMANELERIGDIAVSIAWRAHSLAFIPNVPAPPNISEMALKTKAMLRKSLEALINVEVEPAWEVLDSDDEIDVMNRENFTWIQKQIEADPVNTEGLLYHLLVSRSLERVADHATNLAEDVIYVIGGEIVRHGRKQAER